MLKYCLNRYKTQEVGDKACLPTLKFVPDWSVANKMLIFSTDDINFEEFFSDDIGLVIIDLNNIYLDYDNFMKMILKLLFMLNLWLGVIDISSAKACKRKINEESMSIAWHPKRVWDWCMTKDEKL